MFWEEPVYLHAITAGSSPLLSSQYALNGFIHDLGGKGRKAGVLNLLTKLSLRKHFICTITAAEYTYILYIYMYIYVIT